jgi:hypothetical protein
VPKLGRCLDIDDARVEEEIVLGLVGRLHEGRWIGGKFVRPIRQTRNERRTKRLTGSGITSCALEEARCRCSRWSLLVRHPVPSCTERRSIRALRLASQIDGTLTPIPEWPMAYPVM